MSKQEAINVVQAAAEYLDLIDQDERANELMEALRVLHEAISKYENSRLPPVHMLVELARRYGVSVDYLLGLSDAPNTTC